MISFNSPNTSEKTNIGILNNRYVPVKIASELTGYNIQYLRRMLRSSLLKGIKIGQVWLIDMESLKAYFKFIESTSDRRYGPRKFF
jgi:hypothetical protein